MGHIIKSCFVCKIRGFSIFTHVFMKIPPRGDNFSVLRIALHLVYVAKSGCRRATKTVRKERGYLGISRFIEDGMELCDALFVWKSMKI